MEISINKFVSNTGMCSRREADRWIDDGRVEINGRRAKKGNRVSPGDEVIVDGMLISTKPKHIYVAVNKPPGITCTTDRNEKGNIVDLVDHDERIFPIGRLDKASSGLIFMTNDGDIVNKILREENRHEKEYQVVVDKAITSAFVKKMESGMTILGTKTKPCKVIKTGKTSFTIILTQGLNRQIRRMCEQLDYKVLSLHRTRIMNIHLGKLALGRWRNLTKVEMAALKDQLTSRS